MAVPPPPPAAAQMLAQARDRRERGDGAGALALLRQAAQIAPRHPAILNALGLALIAAGQAEAAVRALSAAVAADPGAPLLAINLADAQRAAGRPDHAIAAIDRALERDPYLLPALVRKGALLEQLDLRDEALRVYRALLRTLPATEPVPAAYADAVAHARALVAGDGATRLATLAATLAATPSPRAQAYLAQLCGVRRIYAPEPTGPYFPFLPAVEYFERAQHPWLDDLEAGFDTIRAELVALWRADAPGFDPYVRFDSTAPVNQWSELNHSPRWSAFFLWKDGRRIEENIARCPNTAALVARLPLLDVPGKAPTVMFSILAPNTRIPAHTGVTNTRATVHLPLVVPGPARFRVGGDTRDWEEGVAWAFDDTIEHEAWNDAGAPRAVLIVDAWNPYLDEAERAVVRHAASEMRL